MVDIIIDTANNASDTIYNTTGAMKEISSNLGVSNGGGVATNNQASTFLISTSQRLDSQAADLQREARKNRRAIDLGLKILYVLSLSLNIYITGNLNTGQNNKPNSEGKKGRRAIVVLCFSPYSGQYRGCTGKATA